MIFYDDHKIDEQYQQMRKLFKELEEDLYSFIGKTKNYSSSTKARKKLMKIKRMVNPLMKSISFQRQDNASQY